MFCYMVIAELGIWFYQNPISVTIAEVITHQRERCDANAENLSCVGCLYRGFGRRRKSDGTTISIPAGPRDRWFWSCRPERPSSAPDWPVALGAPWPAICH